MGVHNPHTVRYGQDGTIRSSYDASQPPTGCGEGLYLITTKDADTTIVIDWNANSVIRYNDYKLSIVLCVCVLPVLFVRVNPRRMSSKR